jgi:hypothetical protein
MRWVLGPLPLLTFLLATALLVNTPVILALFIARRRLSRGAIRGIVAAGFAASTIYMIWRMEWFDVWRHGVPPLTYMIGAFLPYAAVLALAGWGLGALIVPRATMGRGSPNGTRMTRIRRSLE